MRVTWGRGRGWGCRAAVLWRCAVPQVLDQFKPGGEGEAFSFILERPLIYVCDEYRKPCTGKIAAYLGEASPCLVPLSHSHTRMCTALPMATARRPFVSTEMIGLGAQVCGLVGTLHYEGRRPDPEADVCRVDGATFPLHTLEGKKYHYFISCKSQHSKHSSEPRQLACSMNGTCTVRRTTHSSGSCNAHSTRCWHQTDWGADR